MPVLSNFTLNLDQGADTNLTFVWLQSTNPALPPSPVDIAGFTAECMVRIQPSDPSPLISVSTTPNSQGQIILGGVNGTVQLQITNAATSSLPQGLNFVSSYYYSIVLISSLNVRTVLVAGACSVNSAVTYP